MPRLVFQSTKETFATINEVDGRVDVIFAIMRKKAAFLLARIGMTMKGEDGRIVPLTAAGVSARWITYEASQNEASVEVDMVHSTNPEDFTPSGQQIRRVNTELALDLKFLPELKDIPLEEGGGVWGWPLPGAIYVPFGFNPVEEEYDPNERV